MSNVLFPSQVKGFTYTMVKTPEFLTSVNKSPGGGEVRLAESQNPLWHWQLIYDYLYDNYSSPNNTQAYAPYTDLQALMGFFCARGGQLDDFLFVDPDDNYVGPAVANQLPLGTGLQGVGTPNTIAQLQLVNDGFGNYYAPIQRHVGGLFYEDVTDLNRTAPDPFAIYSNGNLWFESTDYTVQGPGLVLPDGTTYEGMYVAFTSPAAWQANTAYALNTKILDPAGHIQMVTTAGTSGAAAPSFNDSGSTTTDNSVTWTDQGYNPGPATPITAQFNYYFRVRFEEDTQDFEKWAAGLWTIGGSSSQNGNGYLKLVTSRNGVALP